MGRVGATPSTLREREEGEEAAGFPALDSIGIVTLDVFSGAGGAVVDGADSGSAGLGEDGGGEVDFVKRGADAGAELHDHFRGVAAEFALHFFNGDGRDAEFAAFAAGVQERDDAALGIDDKNGAAIGDVDAEADARVGGDESVGVRDLRGALRIDDGDFAAVDLIRGDENVIAQSGLMARGDVKFFETRERRFAFHFHIETGNAPDEAVMDAGDFRERGKGFDWRDSLQTSIHGQSALLLA